MRLAVGFQEPSPFLPIGVGRRALRVQCDEDVEACDLDHARTHGTAAHSTRHEPTRAPLQWLGLQPESPSTPPTIDHALAAPELHVITGAETLAFGSSRGGMACSHRRDVFERAWPLTRRGTDHLSTFGLLLVLAGCGGTAPAPSPASPPPLAVAASAKPESTSSPSVVAATPPADGSLVTVTRALPPPGQGGKVFIELTLDRTILSARTRRETTVHGTVRFVLAWKMVGASDFTLTIEAVSFSKEASSAGLSAARDLEGTRYDGHVAPTGVVQLIRTLPHADASYSDLTIDLVAYFTDVVRQSVELALPEKPLRVGESWSHEETLRLGALQTEATLRETSTLVTGRAPLVVETTETMTPKANQFGDSKIERYVDQTVLRRALVDGALSFDLDVDKTFQLTATKESRTSKTDERVRAKARSSRPWSE